ncbi:MAG: transglycosylase domain-containing protein [Anaerolineae bacterium]|nr:transglycosylase domain-containing protein [Anaerolineae bacterium]
MSDRPPEARSASEVTGGWFVPKNAMTEQQIAASIQAQAVGGVAMPDETAPQDRSTWFVPPEAAERVAALKAASAGNSADDKPAEGNGKAADIPQGAALSSEVDYSNYVPGKGFVPMTEAATPGTTSTAPADSSAASTDVQPVAPAPSPADAAPAPTNEPQPAPIGAQAAPAPASPETIYTPSSQQVGAQAAAPSTAQSEAQPAAPVADQANAPADGGKPDQTGPVAAEVPPVNPYLAQRYTDVEQAVQILRRRYAAGSMSRDQLQAELRKLMILDEDGHWWMIGLESDRWYKFNGKDWIPATPPGRTPDDEASKPIASVWTGSTGASLARPAIRATGTAPQAAQPAQPASQQPAPDAADATSSRFNIELDEYGMPLPQRVPITDPGATMVGMAAPRLDNTLKGEPATRPGAGSKFGDGLLNKGVAPYDGGRTVPSAAVQVTQPGAAVSARAVGSPAIPAVGPAVPAVGAAAGAQAPASPSIKPGFQPDYGERPRSIVLDRQRRAGCLIRLAIVSVFVALAGSLIAIAAAIFGYFSIIQRYDAQIAALPNSVQAQSQSARILDATGRILYQLNDPNLGARIYVPLNKIAPEMIAATVSIENERFYEDPGFDVVAIARAVLENLRTSGAGGGASSITQQLTRALILNPGAAQERTASRKITEIIVSSEVARRYTKSQIIEYYLNTIYYGNLAYGVEAAAQTYFGKHANELNLAESIFLAGLGQAPATYDPVLNRNATMLRYDDALGLVARMGCIQMEHDPYDKAPYCITQADVDQAVVLIAQVKAKQFKAPSTTVTYPHFVNYVQQQLEAKFGKDAIYSSGFNVYTTIDPRIQDIADASVKKQIAALKGRNVTNGAVLAVRPQDGAILAMVGSADFNNKDIDGQFNVTLAPRQPGSSIKPFVYLASMERDPNGSYWTPATVLWDVPSCFGGQPAYCPRNYDGQFHGPMSIRAALSNSINIPAVKALQHVGIERFKGLASRVGLEFPLTQPDQAGLPMALGGVEVPLIDMVHGYSVLANYGKRVEFYSITRVTRKNANGDEEEVYKQADQPGQQVVEPALTYLLTSILSDNQARQMAFGNALALPGNRPAAVKTGTTNDSKDNWTIGYTQQLVVGVWVGNSNNTPMIGTSGVTGAAPIWKDVMAGALASQPAAQFPAPPNVQQMNVCADLGTQDFPECKTRRAEVFFAPNPPPPAAEMFKTLQVDSFSGLIANQYCPDYVQNKTYLIVNDATALAWLNNDAKGQQWAKDRGIELPVVPPPTQQCDPNTPRPVLRVANPLPNSQVQGLVEVRGQVIIPGFNRYQLEVGQGANPTQFNIVDGPIMTQQSGENSFLGRWDTATVQNGQYTLRLWAVDAQGHHAEITVPVIVNNLAPTEIPTQPPVVIPTAAPGQPTAQPGQQPGLITATPIIINPNPVQPTQAQPGQQQPVQVTATPIVIDPNPAQPVSPGGQVTPTMKPLFPPTATRQP